MKWVWCQNLQDTTAHCLVDVKRTKWNIPDTTSTSTTPSHGGSLRCRKLSYWKLFRWLPLHYHSVQGAPAEKLTVGMPTFGHGWELMDESEVMILKRSAMENISPERVVLLDSRKQPTRAVHWPTWLPRILRDLASSQQWHVSLANFGWNIGKIIWDDVLHSFKICTVCLGCLEQLLRLGRLLWMDAILLLTSQMDLGEWTTKSDHQDAQEIWTQSTSFRWVGYDDVDSIRLKAQFVNSRGLAGSMIW